MSRRLARVRPPDDLEAAFLVGADPGERRDQLLDGRRIERRRRAPSGRGRRRSRGGASPPWPARQRPLTVPSSASAAMSVLPAPMSMTRWPLGPLSRTPAPIAAPAARRAGRRSARRRVRPPRAAPRRWPPGSDDITAITTSGLKIRCRPAARIIAWLTSHRAAAGRRSRHPRSDGEGGSPDLRRQSRAPRSPKTAACTSPPRIATAVGSLPIMPSPLTMIRVVVVPRSIPTFFPSTAV